VLERYPEVYQWVLARVKPVRDAMATRSKDSAQYAAKWWLFGKPRESLRPALAGLPRYIATIETSKHRFFVFLPAEVLPDNMLVNVASEDAYHLGVLSSRIHTCWALAAGGTLVDGPRYTKTRCFDPFPFPIATPQQEERIRGISEKLDAHRWVRLEQHPDLTMTGLYNVLEALRAGRELTASEKNVYEAGLVSILRKLHDELDTAVAQAYSWPVELPDEEILSRLVALNAERAEEEKDGNIRWLRPEYQTMSENERQKQAELALAAPPPSRAARKPKPGKDGPSTKLTWPTELLEQTIAVRDAVAFLRAKNVAVTTDRVAACFERVSRKKIEEILLVFETLGISVP